MSSKIAAVKSLIVGTLTTQGVSPAPLKDFDTLPWVTLQLVSAQQLEALDATTGSEDSLIQINCFDKDYEVADALRTSIKNILEFDSGSIGGRVISAANHRGDFEIYNPETEIHQLITRFRIWWGG